MSNAAAGQEAQAWPAEAVDHLIGYDAFVVGSAVYAAHWQKEASAFVRRNHALLASRPAWLFSSGPLGTEAADAKGRDLTVAAKPKEIAEFEGAIGPKGHRVFFGALDPGTLGVSERAIRKLPAARTMLPEGDFRDWAEIDAWRATSPTNWRSEEETSFAPPRTAGAVEEGHDAPPGLLRRGRVAGERNAPRS